MAGKRNLRPALAAGILLLLLLAFDLARAPHRQWSAAVLLASLDVYQARVSPLLASAGVGCRFRPSCSRYGEGAIRARGALGGTFLTARRLLRCGPWTPAGTIDPPPEPPDADEKDSPPSERDETLGVEMLD